MNSDNRFSESEFYRFVEEVSSKGFIKSSKARNWKGAVHRLLGTAEDVDKSDLRSVDINILIKNYASTKGEEVSESSLKTYSSRFSSAMNEFFSWAQDPMSYESHNNISSSNSKFIQESKMASPSKLTETKTESSVVIPVPLSDGRIITINNLPNGLREQDVDRICAIIKAFLVKEN